MIVEFGGFICSLGAIYGVFGGYVGSVCLFCGFSGGALS